MNEHRGYHSKRGNSDREREISHDITYKWNLRYKLTCLLNKNNLRASLVVQWLRSHLPRQETQVQSLLQEDPTHLEVTKPVSHDC